MQWCVGVVHEDEVAVVEQCGRFHRIAPAGCVWIWPCLCQSATARISLRLQQLELSVTSKSKDNVFVTVKVVVQYRVDKSNARLAHYKLHSPSAQMTAWVYDVVRGQVRMSSARLPVHVSPGGPIMAGAAAHSR